MSRIAARAGFALGMTYIMLRIQGFAVPELFSSVLVGIGALLLYDRVVEWRQS